MFSNHGNDVHCSYTLLHIDSWSYQNFFGLPCAYSNDLMLNIWFSFLDFSSDNLYGSVCATNSEVFLFHYMLLCIKILEKPAQQLLQSHTNYGWSTKTGQMI
jgi:hypothetical protein